MSTCQQCGPEISWTVDDRTQDQMDSDLIHSIEKAMGLPRHRRYSKTKPRHRREKSRRGVKS